MGAEEEIVNLFTTRVRQMMLQYKDMKLLNEELREKVARRENEIAGLKQQLEEARMEFQRLKMAKMLEVTDGDMETAQKHIAKLIRDVNKCITLLSE